MNGHKVIQTRWLDIDRGVTSGRADIRSRCVAKEFATEAKDDIFAATLVLEAVKAMISLLASSRHGKTPTQRVMVMDVKRAFLHAPVTRDVFVELPWEAKRNDECDIVGKLCKAMYGTRDAPLSWQRHLSQVLAEIGFEKGVSQPCVLRQSLKNLKLIFHVDDLMIIGEPMELKWVRIEIENASRVRTRYWGLVRTSTGK